MKTDVIVIGSGPGGATVARALAQAGKSVQIFERGQDHRGRWYYGTYLGAMRYTDRGSFLFTRQGMNIIRPLMVGGATSMFCGCATPPPNGLFQQHGIDLDPFVESTITELEIAPLSAELRGAASTHMADAGRSLGLDWQPLPKFMRPNHSKPFACGAHCMLGCRCDAKWNAGSYVQEAVDAGARLMTGVQVDSIYIDSGQATGIRGRQGGRQIEASAETIILAAGGIGSPRILQNSGIDGAGDGITMDTTRMVYGVGPEAGNGHEPPMSWYAEDPQLEVLYSTLIDPWLLYPLMSAMSGLKHSLSWTRWKRTMGVMIKLKDHLAGGVRANGQIDKPQTASDRERMAEAEIYSRKLLIEAGARPDSIFSTPLRGTHPSSSVRIGHLLNSDLASEIDGLYVCDASVFPEALGRPTVLTIIALAKRLADQLINGAR